MADLLNDEEVAVPEIHVGEEEEGNKKKNSSFSSDSDNEIKQKPLNLIPRLKRQDSGSSLGEDEFVLTDELRDEIVTQAEYYFSDENLKKDGFLLKHVKRNKEGYVNLKLLASFKRMKTLTRDYKVIGDAIKAASKHLVINETGLKLRRIEPLPKELLEQTRVKHVVVSKIPNENPSMNYITDAFTNNKDDVVSVRIIKSGKKFPNDLQSHFSRHSELRDETVAVVEFENPDIAGEAIKTVFTEQYMGLNVRLLELGPKQGKKKENGESASDFDSDASIGGRKKNNKKLLKEGFHSSSYASSSDGEFSAFSSYGKRYARSHGNSPMSSPQNPRKFDRNNNSYNSSPHSSPSMSPKFNKKNKKTPDRSAVQKGHKLSPLITGGGSPMSSPDVKRRDFFFERI